MAVLQVLPTTLTASNGDQEPITRGDTDEKCSTTEPELDG